MRHVRSTRAILTTATLFATFLAVPAHGRAQGTPTDTLIPVTGVDVPELAAYDQLILGLMKKYHMPGAAVAVVKGSKLIYAHGFGWADIEQRTPMQPDALFRIASVSKPITAVAIMTLVEQKKLSLDDKVWPLIDDLAAAPGAKPDPRWQMITIRHLLNHSGGWDRDKSGDPMFRPLDVASGFRQTPTTAETIIRGMKSQRLDFTPGTRHAYSNFGYAILGHVIERVTGAAYDDYVKRKVLQPAGITRMELGRSRIINRIPGEVSYYFPDRPLAYPMTKSVFPGEQDVPQAYGGFYLEAMAAHGGWVASTIDLLRFVNVVDGRSAVPDILGAAAQKEMLWHDTKAYPERDVWYGAGWGVRPAGDDYNYWHDGSLPGTVSLLVRAHNDMAWAVLLNAGDSGSFTSELDAGMWSAMRAVTAWPERDLFRKYQ